MTQAALTFLGAGDGTFMGITKTDLAEIALLQGDLTGARQGLQEVIPPAPRHARRFMVFLCALAGYPVHSPTHFSEQRGHLRSCGDRSMICTIRPAG